MSLHRTVSVINHIHMINPMGIFSNSQSPPSPPGASALKILALPSQWSLSAQAIVVHRSMADAGANKSNWYSANGGGMEGIWSCTRCFSHRSHVENMTVLRSGTALYNVCKL